MRRSSAVIVISALAGAVVFAAAAAYASQTAAQNASFDSNLPEFMKRTESSLLKIVRHDSGGNFQNVDEYSLATTDAQLYRYLGAVDKVHNSPAASSGIQMAYIEVVVSSTETLTILKEIRPEEQAQQENPDYDLYSKQIEVSDRYYTLELFIPR